MPPRWRRAAQDAATFASVHWPRPEPEPDPVPNPDGQQGIFLGAALTAARLALHYPPGADMRSAFG